jgi:predicted DNA-binding protein (UPF0251 family)/predicted Fe-Mo cluster-binding NifX family protein
MPRPLKYRQVHGFPPINYFKPRGVPLRKLTEVCLSVEGYEALRFIEIEGLSHEEAAEYMNISRHTFGRILAEARRTVAEAVVKGQALRIEGGNYVITGGDKREGFVAFDQKGQNQFENRQLIPEFRREMEEITSKDLRQMKLAITSEGPTLEAQINPRFGRAPGFIIIDPKTMEFDYIDNSISQTMAQGAGKQAAELVANAGATVVLTGFVGPKALQALTAAGIRVGQDLGGITVREAANKFLNGEIKISSDPNK